MNVIFVHIPKAGGTTFRTLLKNNFPSEQVCPEQHNHLDRFTYDQLKSYRLFSGHFDRDSCDQLPDPKVFVTILRDPTSRVVSTYKFWRAHKMSYLEKHPEDFMKIAKTKPLEEFLESRNLVVRQYIDNGMVRQLASVYPRHDCDPLWEDPDRALDKAKMALHEMAAFGLQERYPQSVAFILDKLGFAIPSDITAENVTDSRAQSDPTMEPPNMPTVPRGTLTVIRDMNRLDYKLYRYAQNLFRYRYYKWRFQKKFGVLNYLHTSPR